jgi:hypothetical protein
MPEQNIESHICDSLTGDAQTNALRFVSHLRALGVKFERGTGYWADKRYWMIKHKGACVCFVLINGYGEKAHKDEPDGWIIWSDDYSSDIFANFPLDKNIKQIAWEHIDFCANCGSCSGGTRKTIFGKAFENVCTTTFRFDNPDAETVECAKKMVEIRKNEIDGKRD